MKSRNELKLGSLLSYGQMFLNILIGLVYTPVMIRLLGKSEYGLYNTVSSTISMLSILNLGFSSSYIRYFAKYKKEKEETKIHKLNGMFLLIFICIGVIALLSGLYLAFHLNLVFDTGLTEAEYRTAKVLMLLLTGGLAISFPMTVFTCIISAHEKFTFLKLLGMGKTVLSPLVTLPVLLMGYRSVGMVTIGFLVGIVVDIIYIVYTFRVIKAKFVFHGFEKGLLKSLFTYTVFIAINLIIDQINWNIDKILLGRFQGTVMVAIYSVGYSLYSYYMNFSTSISGVFTPRIHKIVNETADDAVLQKSRLTELFIRVGRIQFLLLGLLASGIVFFGESFIVRYWVGAGYEDAYWVAILLILPASIALIQNLGIEIQRAENKHQFRSIVYLAMAIINLVLSVILCQKYGAIGSAIGTAIALIVAIGIIMNIYYHKRCNIDILLFWKSILQSAKGLLLPVAFGVFCHWFFPAANLGIYLLQILLYTIIYSDSVWMLSMNDYVKSLVMQPLQKIVKGVKND